MRSDAFARFVASMELDFDKWHDGTGYDLTALDEMTPEQREDVVRLLRAESWRDLEALGHIGTPTAFAAIENARKSEDPGLRLRAMQYGQAPVDPVREAAILAALSDEGSRSDAIDQASENPSPKIVRALLEIVLTGEGVDAYSAAATLMYIHGLIDSPYSWDERPFLLRLAESESPDRDAAFRELSERINVEP